MGEALPESLSIPHAKARALLEVVRLAFEGGIGFGSESAGANGTAATVDGDLLSGPASSSRQKLRDGKEHMQQVHVHASHRPASAGSSSRLVPGGPCMWCGVTATPQWRRPRGTNKLLCNACGIFFTRYGRLPERSQHLHVSNTHAAAGQNMSLAGLGAVDCVAEHADSQPEQPYSAAKTDPESTASGSRTRLLQPGQPQPQQPTSSGTGISPHKRKDAPQPEAELLHGLDDSPASAGVDCPAPLAGVRTVTAAPSPCITPQRPSSIPGTPPDQQSMPVPVVAASAAAPDGSCATAPLPDAAAQAPTMLAVAPLDLGLHQVALVGQPLGCLATLPPLCLNGAAAPAAAATPGSGISCSAAYGAATMATVTGNRSPATVTVLPPELLGRPFALPAGLLPGGVALLDAAAAAGIQAPPRSLYARPSKRQERLPAGDSEDSNASTDSHTGPHGEAGTSHDEDDGGTTTTTTHALRGLSSSPPLLPSLHFPPALFGRPVAVPMLTAPTGTLPMAPGASGLGAVGVVGLTVGFAAGGGVAVAPSVSIGGQGLPEEQQHQQPVIFLQTRRSKGPRSRASSATPSSSTQS